MLDRRTTEDGRPGAFSAALVALAIFLVGDDQAQAQQAPITLVSNIGQTAETNPASRTTSGVLQSQRFTTGSSAGGYILSSIEAKIKSNPTQAERNTVRAHLWSATTGGAPNAKLKELTVPAHPITAGNVSFAAPADTTLNPNTTYFLVLFTQTNFNLQIASTQSDNEDTSGQSGWSIHDVFHIGRGSQGPSPSVTWEEHSSNASLMIRVNGYEAPPPAAPTDLRVRPGISKLDLTWTAPAGTLTGYDVHYTSSGSVADDAAAGSDVTTGWVDANHAGTAASHEIMDLITGTAYRVRVRARNAAGTGAWAHGTGIPQLPTQISSPDLPDITLDVDVFYLNERDDKTIITVTAEMAWAATQDTTVALSLRSSPLLTPGVRGASSSDYSSDMVNNLRYVTIMRGKNSASTTIAIDPTYDTHVEGDEAIVVTGDTEVADLTVAPTDVIIEDGPYLSFPEYIYGRLHYPGEQISVPVEQAINQAAPGTVTYSLTKTEPAGNPLGLTFNPATRRLTGTAPADTAVPTEGITTRYTITARDSAGHTATTIVSVAVVKDVCSSTTTTWFHATN